MKDKIFYIDALPGSGKTHTARMEMKNDVGSIHFYVAPTHALANQTFRDLIDDGVTVRRLWKIGDNEDRYSLSNGLEKRVKGTPDGTSAAVSQLIMDASAGAIVIMTHQAFVQLPKLTESRNIRVFFDEARKFVLSNGDIEFDGTSDKKYLRTLLKRFSECLPGSKTQQRRMVFRKVYIPETFEDTGDGIHRSTIAIAKSLSGTSTNRKQYSAILTWITNCRDPRMEMYVATRMLDDEWVPVTSKEKMTLHQVVVPSRMFSGFKSVLLMSAYFTTSQMYHLLNDANEVSLVNLYPTLPLAMLERERRIKDRFSYARLIPLMHDTNKVTRTRLDNDVLVPAEYLENMLNVAHRLEVTSRDIKRFKTGKVSGSDDKACKFMRMVDRCGGAKELIDWYYESASKIVEHLGNRVKHPPLLVTNNDSRYDRTRKFSKLKKRAAADGVFHVMTSSSHGFNHFDKRNAIAYFSAINPTPEISKLFRTILRRYDPDEDYAADSCIQAITRTSVRVPTATDKVYIILPDMGLAQMARSKMFDACPRPQKSWADHFDMASIAGLLVREAVLAGSKNGGSRNSDKFRIFRSPERIELERRLNNLNVAIHRAAKAEDVTKENSLNAERESVKKRIGLVEQKDNPDMRRVHGRLTRAT